MQFDLSAYGQGPTQFYGEKKVEGAYKGDGGELFMLALSTGIITLLTLGFYRFWAKTRIRRYMWSAISPDKSPFEYTGTGLEKLLGFLIAVVVLAVYLGIVQIGLMYAGFSMIWTGGESEAEQLLQAATGSITFVAVLPLIFIAQYRSRRYMLARTRWRGIRFGMAPGALGYMAWAFALWIAVISSLGTLLPLATFYLEKYKADRTFYGNAQMTQGGRWYHLYRALVPFAIGILVMGVALIFASMPGSGAFGVIAIGLAGLWLLVGVFHYRVQSFAIMARNKTLDNGVTFESEPLTGPIMKAVIMGSLAVSFIVFLVTVILVIVYSTTGAPLAAATGVLTNQVSPIFIAVPVVLYLMTIVLSNALRMVFIHQPILKHYVETFTLRNAEKLDAVRQRQEDEFADADGFADALDVGAAI